MNKIIINIKQVIAQLEKEYLNELDVKYEAKIIDKKGNRKR